MNRKLLIPLFSLIIISFLIFIIYLNDKKVNWPKEIWDEGIPIEVDLRELNKWTDHAFSLNSNDELGITNALLIVQDGRVVFERYNNGINKNTKLVSWSMAKSFTGAITGIMIEKGYISSIHEKI